MMLTPCSVCARHVDAAEPSCPFCGAAVSPPPPRALRQAVGVGRAALFSFGVMLAGCDAEPAPVPVYGGPPVPPEQNLPVPVYGGPPGPVEGEDEAPPTPPPEPAPPSVEGPAVPPEASEPAR